MPEPSGADLTKIESATEAEGPEPRPPAVTQAKPLSRLRPTIGIWLRDLTVSLAISAFIIVFIYQPVKVEARA